MLVFCFIGACVTAGSAVSAGIIIPVFIIGACFGRIIGKVCVDIVGDHDANEFTWVEPGLFALIGAGCCLTGVTRLTMSITVMMMEISDNVNTLLLQMAATMVAKWTADYIDEMSLFHYNIKKKSMPLIHEEIPSKTSMERYKVGQIMSKPAVCVSLRPSVISIKDILLHSPTHQAFPVVRQDGGNTVLVGMILRQSLLLLVTKTESHFSGDQGPPAYRVAYPELRELEIHAKLTDAVLLPVSDELEDSFVDLTPYIDESHFVVYETFSVKQAHLLFRKIGLRHLPVVNSSNEPVGMITRKDVAGFELMYKLEA